VEAMIFHAVSIAAFFVDQLEYEPIVLQCVPAEPESWVKWPLPTIVQTVVSLASITAGVLIAVWSFRKNRQSEHEQWVRNQRAGHEQWIRDQKKAEWKELISHVAVIEKEVPIILSGVHKYEKLEPAVLAIVAMLDDTLFIRSKLQASGFIGRWMSFISFVSNQFLPAVHQNNYATNEMLGGRLDIDTQQRIEEKWLRNEDEIRRRLSELLNDLRTIAHDDMEIQVIA
jgi:hypothetical protein